MTNTGDMPVEVAEAMPLAERALPHVGLCLPSGFVQDVTAEDLAYWVSAQRRRHPEWFERDPEQVAEEVAERFEWDVLDKFHPGTGFAAAADDLVELVGGRYEDAVWFVVSHSGNLEVGVAGPHHYRLVDAEQRGSLFTQAYPASATEAFHDEQEG